MSHRSDELGGEHCWLVQQCSPVAATFSNHRFTAASDLAAEGQAETKGQLPIPFGIGGLVRADVSLQNAPGMTGERAQHGSRLVRGPAVDVSLTPLAGARRPFPGGRGESQCPIRHTQSELSFWLTSPRPISRAISNLPRSADTTWPGGPQRNSWGRGVSPWCLSNSEDRSIRCTVIFAARNRANRCESVRRGPDSRRIFSADSRLRRQSVVGGFPGVPPGEETPDLSTSTRLCDRLPLGLPCCVFRPGLGCREDSRRGAVLFIMWGARRFTIRGLSIRS